MRYLVTGGLGVVGSRFAQLAASAGHSVTVLDAAEEPRNFWMWAALTRDHPDNVKVIQARVEATDFEPLLANHDAVLHAAAHTGIPHSSQDPNDDWISNVDASRNILEAMRRMKSSTPVVMLSSVKPYQVRTLPYRTATMTLGERMVFEEPYVDGVDENCLLEPDEPYAASKMAQTALVMAYGRSYDLPVTVLRCSNLYGDAPCHGPRHGWLTWFCISAAVGWPIELQGSGYQTRDMLFSDDVASATHAALANIGSIKGNVYNIGGGNPNTISCKQAVSLIEEILGRKVDVRGGPGRKDEDMIFVTNHGKFTSRTGWAPTVSVKDGVTRILKWADANANGLRTMYKDVV